MDRKVDQRTLHIFERRCFIGDDLTEESNDRANCFSSDYHQKKRKEERKATQLIKVLFCNENKTKSQRERDHRTISPASSGRAIRTCIDCLYRAPLPLTFCNSSSILHPSFRPLTSLLTTSRRKPARLEPTPFLLGRMSTVEVSTISPSYARASREEFRPSKAEQPAASLSTRIVPNNPKGNHERSMPLCH